MGPGARPLQPGENTGGLLKEISDIRSHYNVHVGSNAIELAYELKGQQRHYSLPFDNIPIGGWTRSLCWGGPSSAAVSGTMLIDIIRGVENVSGRQINQQEAEGLAFYSSRRMMTLYTAQLSAFALGYGVAWRGRKEMKFPFMKPKDPARYEAFPMRVLPLLSGQYARTMWHITRANVYVLVCLFGINPLARSMADTRMTVGIYQDPRTHDLATTLKDKFDRLRMNRAQDSADRSKPDATLPSQRNQIENDDNPQVYNSVQDHNSQANYASDNTFTDSGTDTGLMDDGSTEQAIARQPSPNAWSKAQSRASRPSVQQPDKKSATQSNDFFFDDASPTAGNDPDMSAPQPYQRRPAQQSAGAWDRIRRSDPGQSVSGSQRGSQPSGRNQAPEFEPRGESFSFSKGEEEKRLAREQAQKDFDDLLDRERREGGSSEYLRDMRATESGEESSLGTENAWARRRRG